MSTNLHCSPASGAADEGRGHEEAEAQSGGSQSQEQELASSFSSLSMAQALYTDGLQSIFQFLPLGDLLFAIQSCRFWRSAAYKQNKSRGVKLRVLPKLLESLLSSPLRHHVSALDFAAHPDATTLKSLAQLAPQLPSLTSVDILTEAESLLELWQSSANSMGEETTSAGVRKLAAQRLAASWPPRLHRLSLELRAPDSMTQVDFDRAAQLLVDTFALFPSTLAELTLNCRDVEVSEWAFDLLPLVALSDCLRKLELFGMSLSDADMRAVQQLGALESLVTNEGDWPLEELAILCTPPHRLQRLESLDLCQTILSPAHLVSLAHLPALTAMKPRAFELEALPLLSGFRLLRTLHVSQTALGRVGGLHDLLPHLPPCAALTQLSLSLFALLPAHLAQLAAAAPSLESLCLEDGSVSSLAGLRLMRRLRQLTLWSCRGLTSDDLEELQHVPTLRTLEVQFSDENQTNAAQVKYLPPSKLLAHVESI